MDVVSQSAYLLRVKRMCHNSEPVVVLTLSDVRSGRVITVSAPDLLAALSALCAQLALGPEGNPATPPVTPSLPCQRSCGPRLRLRSRLRSGQTLRSFAWSYPAENHSPQQPIERGRR